MGKFRLLSNQSRGVGKMKQVASYGRPVLNSFGSLSLHLITNKIPGRFFIIFTTPANQIFSTESIWPNTYLRRNSLFIEYDIQKILWHKFADIRMPHMLNMKNINL